MLAEPAVTINGFVIESDEGGRIERRIVELQPGGQAHALAAIRSLGARIILITPEEE